MESFGGGEEGVKRGGEVDLPICFPLSQFDPLPKVPVEGVDNFFPSVGHTASLLSPATPLQKRAPDPSHPVAEENGGFFPFELISISSPSSKIEEKKVWNGSENSGDIGGRNSSFFYRV